MEIRKVDLLYMFMKNEKIMETNQIYGIDAEQLLTQILIDELHETKEQFYERIKTTLNIESFMKATNNNLDMLFKYMYSATNGIRLSNITVGEFIKDEYDDDFYYRRECLRLEEIERNEKNYKNN